MAEPDVHTDRCALRARLRQQREAYTCESDFAWAVLALGQHLDSLLEDLAPRCLGGYWPLREEFNPWTTPQRSAWPASMHLALPRAWRQPRRMTYHLWNGDDPPVLDGFGIPTSDGPEVQPDVVLAPCVGYTRNGWRVGYGGGFFDAYLAAHPDVLPVGIAWSCSEVDVRDFTPAAHDRPMSIIVTDKEILRC